MKALLSLLFAAFVLLTLAAGFVLFGDRSLPVASTDVIVAPGSDFGHIAMELQAHGVTRYAIALRALARARGVEAKIQAGEYRFPAHLSTAALLDHLLVGGRRSVWVTIPEGFTDAQIADRLARAGVAPARALKRAFAHDSVSIDGEHITGLEGFLFPDTYLVPIGAAPSIVEGQMLARFRQELPADALARAKALHVTVLGAITIASMIEREAMRERERPIIASVIYNRLRIGMPLQIDATIEYALPEHSTTLTYADLKVASPYNTYLHRGLPPGPIANPGLPSIEAALHPAQTDFLYYVAKGDGSHAFATTLAQQNANVARYLH